MEMITILGAGQTATVTGEQLDAIVAQVTQEGTDAPQLSLPWPLDRDKLAAFLTQWCAIEDEQERLRSETLELKAEYEVDLPIRAILTAVKIVRARRKLETHPKEGMKREDLAQFEAVVDRHLAAMDAAKQAAADEAERSAQRPPVPDMTGGGPPHEL